MGHRLAPDRVLPYWHEVLSAEAARQCIAEWDAYRAGGGERVEACERMAILADLARQQAAIHLERQTGEAAPRWVTGANRTRLAGMLERATRSDPDDLDPQTVRRLRSEVERPYHEHVARTKGKTR